MATQVLSLGSGLLQLSPAATDLVNNVTGALVVITGGNTVQFPNYTGQTLLFISVGGTGGTVQCNVGTTIFGQSFAAFTAVSLTASTLYVMGPFHSALDIPTTINVTVVTSGALVSSMAALQLLGVY
jgi:hypothetical protein